MKVLIVDDNRVYLEVLRGVLEYAGHEVLEAQNGQQAVQCIRSEGVRLVVSDWEMPCMSGLELCRELRSQAGPCYIYVILLTSRHTQDEIVEGLTAGADDFVAKPFHPAELLARIRTGERILGLETRDVAIFSLVRLAQSREPDTGAHLERVRAYCGLLAQDMLAHHVYSDELDAEFTRLIRETSPLHDIGKVAIPDRILNKPGPLTTDEVATMRTHAAIGARTFEEALNQFPEVKFLGMARDIAATHHERWNGTGYPRRLRGLEIPLSGRMTAVADVYDALTSRRVYKPVFRHDLAARMIREDAGVAFDAKVVDAFLRVERQFRDISAESGEGAD